MPVTVAVNMLTVVHKDSNGMATFMPDVCLTPAPPAPPVPIPYPNIAMSSDTSQGSSTVKCDGNPVMLQGSQFSTSTGDEAGSAGGVVCGVTKGKAEFILYSFDVSFDGKPVARALDLMLGNKGGTFNTPPMPCVQAPQAGVPLSAEPDVKRKPDKLEIAVKDGAGNVLKDERFVLEKPDGSRQEGKTDGEGKIKLDETVSGIGRITFPDRPGATLELGT
jgi:hypothetical protein